MPVKLYSSDRGEGEGRNSPAGCTGRRTVKIKGRPEPEHISTSFVERQNLATRTQMRRFTRLTNAWSKRVENHMAAIALHYMHYNSCRIH
jgi:hypothetical protein